MEEPALDWDDGGDENKGDTGKGRCLPILRWIKIPNLLKDLGGVYEKTNGRTQYPLGLKTLEDADHVQHEDDHHGRNHHGQGYPHHGAQIGCPRHGAGFFQGQVHVAKGRCEQHDLLGDGVAEQVGTIIPWTL